MIQRAFKESQRVMRSPLRQQKRHRACLKKPLVRKASTACCATSYEGKQKDLNIQFPAFARKRREKRVRTLRRPAAVLVRRPAGAEEGCWGVKVRVAPESTSGSAAFLGESALNINMNECSKSLMNRKAGLSPSFHAAAVGQAYATVKLQQT